MITLVLVACAPRMAPPPEQASEATEEGMPPGLEGLPEEPSPADITREAVARLAPSSGTRVSGLVSFREVVEAPPEPIDATSPWQPAREVEVEVEVRNAEPGSYLLRVHEVADCGAADASSAGRVFDMGGGTEDIAGRAAGELGRLEVGQDGRAHADITTDRITLGPGRASVAERSVVLSLPLGGSAERRVACGVIVPEVASGSAGHRTPSGGP